MKPPYGGGQHHRSPRRDGVHRPHEDQRERDRFGEQLPQSQYRVPLVGFEHHVLQHANPNHRQHHFEYRRNPGARAPERDLDHTLRTSTSASSPSTSESTE